MGLYCHGILPYTLKSGSSRGVYRALHVQQASPTLQVEAARGGTPDRRGAAPRRRLDALPHASPLSRMHPSSHRPNRVTHLWSTGVDMDEVTCLPSNFAPHFIFVPIHLGNQCNMWTPFTCRLLQRPRGAMLPPSHSMPTCQGGHWYVNLVQSDDVINTTMYVVS